MDNKLKTFLEQNQKIRDKEYDQNAPHFFNSLRHGFEYYYQTFLTKNSMYEYYAFASDLHINSFSGDDIRNADIEYINREFTDENNFLLSIISFQRFFELLMKKVLRDIDERLILKVHSSDILSIINPNVKLAEPFPKIEAGEATARIEQLFSKKGTENFDDGYLPNYKRVKNVYGYLGKELHINTMKQLNDWRNRLLHGGNVFPNLRSLDYFFCRHIVPLVRETIGAFNHIENTGVYHYFETMTGIKLLDEIEKIDIVIDLLNISPLSKKTSWELLKLGHIKEIGRANMEMNLISRLGYATYEYNYHDVFGRSIRFAEAEKKHEHFRAIKECPCCGKESLVLYEHIINDLFNFDRKKSIQWVKCYTCSYHIRFNVGDPYDFGLSKEPVFDYKPRYSLRLKRPVDP